MFASNLCWQLTWVCQPILHCQLHGFSHQRFQQFHLFPMDILGKKFDFEAPTTMICRWNLLLASRKKISSPGEGPVFFLVTFCGEKSPGSVPHAGRGYPIMERINTQLHKKWDDKSGPGVSREWFYKTQDSTSQSFWSSWSPNLLETPNKSNKSTTDFGSIWKILSKSSASARIQENSRKCTGQIGFRLDLNFCLFLNVSHGIFEPFAKVCFFMDFREPGYCSKLRCHLLRGWSIKLQRPWISMGRYPSTRPTSSILTYGKSYSKNVSKWSLQRLYQFSSMCIPKHVYPPLWILCSKSGATWLAGLFMDVKLPTWWKHDTKAYHPCNWIRWILWYL